MTQTVTRNTDSEMYNGPDSGCQLATSLIGHPSSCRACPFGHWKCVYDMTPTERNKIIVWLRTTPTPDQNNCATVENRVRDDAGKVEPSLNRRLKP